MTKRNMQLGMNHSTASNRLVKDILYSLIVETGKDICYQCNEKIKRENLSIEHKVPWLDSENPLEMYFDLSNIAFSHLKCNVGAARKNLAECGTDSAYQRGCRCRPCMDAAMITSRNKYTPEKRRERYLRNGK